MIIVVCTCAFAQEKGKYEITVGGLKAAEDLADYWGDITTKYPSVIGIIDPMRRVVSAVTVHRSGKYAKFCMKYIESMQIYALLIGVQCHEKVDAYKLCSLA